MPETNGGTAAATAGGDAPETGNAAGGQDSQNGAGQAPADQAPPTGETVEQRLDRLEAENRALRRENGDRRRAATAAETAAEQARQAGMSEAERAVARATAAEEANARLVGQLRSSALSAAAITAATKLGYRNPELAVRLLDRDAIEWDDETNQPKGVEAQLAKLAKDDAYLTKPAAGDYGGGNRGTAPAGKPGMNELLRAALAGE